MTSTERIEAFLDKSVWLIAPDRPQTRTALVECLTRIPAPLLEAIVGDLRILVAAPPVEMTASCFPWGFTSTDSRTVNYQFVLLDGRLESMPYPQARKAILFAFDFAFSRVSGIPEDQALRIADECIEGRMPS